MDKTDDKGDREEKTMNSSNSIKTKDMAYIALCAVLLAVCSWISIPFTVPFTLQTFAVFCTLLILGGKRGTVAVAVYILMAAVGLPVLSGFRGGAGALLGTTGGYILGFILTGLIYWLSEKLLADSPVIRIAALVCGLAVCYAICQEHRSRGSRHGTLMVRHSFHHSGSCKTAACRSNKRQG